MLVLSRKESERVRIEVGGRFIWITLVKVDRGKVRLGIEAGKEAKVMREELLHPNEQYGKIASVPCESK